MQQIVLIGDMKVWDMYQKNEVEEEPQVMETEENLWLFELFCSLHHLISLSSM